MLESRLLTAEGTWSMIKRGTLRCPRAVSQLAQSRDSKYRDREGHPILWRRWAPQSAAQGPHIMGMDWCMAPQVQLCTCRGLLPHPATSCHVLPLPSSPPPNTAPAVHTSVALLCGMAAASVVHRCSRAWDVPGSVLWDCSYLLVHWVPVGPQPQTAPQCSKG